ncbi:MAG: radical SAM protein, partial [Bacteroidota bacterium]
MSHPIRNGKLQTRLLEYSAAYHCNLNCAHCSHLSPYTPRGFPSCDSLAADLERLAIVLHTEEFRLLGGEPLLNPELPTLAQIVRDSGITDTLVVTTNGLLLHRMDERLWPIIDRLDVTIYPDA